MAVTTAACLRRSWNCSS